MISSSIQNIVTIINKDIQKGNKFVDFVSIVNLTLERLELKNWKPKKYQQYILYKKIARPHHNYLTILFLNNS